MADALRLKLLPILLLIGFIAGCASTTESKGNKVDIAPGVTLALPDRPPFGRAVNVVQLVQAVYRDRRETFQAVIASKDDGMTLIMTVPNGPRIMSLEWREGVVAKFESIAPKGLSAENMLADIMTIYASPEILRNAIDGADLTVKADGTREIAKHGQAIVRVTFPAGSGADPWNGRAVLENLIFGYKLMINSRLTAP